MSIIRLGLTVLLGLLLCAVLGAATIMGINNPARVRYSIQREFEKEMGWREEDPQA